MATNKRELGIHKIYIGDVPSDGVTEPAVSAMTLIGHNVKPDSIAPESEDNTYVETKNQEDNTVDMSILTEVGKKSFLFETWDYGFENLINVMGGEVVDYKWVAPVEAFAGKEVCLLVVSDAAKGMHQKQFYPRVKMYGKALDKGNNAEPGSIQYNFTILTPKNASDENVSDTYRYFTPAAPTSGIVNDTADTFAFTTVDNFTDVTKYEYSNDNGVAWTDVTVNPITGITGSVPIGEFQVRVKENKTVTPRYSAGYVLASTEAFTV